jgi:energy-coupling factor transporter transmembrane protein EcfT
MNRSRRSRRSTHRWIAWVGAVVLALTAVVGPATAHTPDPSFAGGPFGQNQVLAYRWRAGAEPASVIKTAINAAAAAVKATRASKAATFSYSASGSNPIGYGTGATCGVNGLACFTRNVPNGFTVWLREQGHVFDWGTLKWCQAYSTAPNGCYDAEAITLDELGHVEGLDHHVNYASNADYLDAVVQTYSRTKPSSGWNAHAFGRCDVATLQTLYDMLSWSARYSTCLDLTTVLTLTASPTTLVSGGTTTLTASLKVYDADSYRQLGGNPVSGRTVTLQRRAPGATTWTSIGTMPAGSTAGTYVLSQRPGADTDYRAVFATPSTEGINGDDSATIRVTVSGCSGATALKTHASVVCY